MEMLDCNICGQKYNDHMVVRLPQGMCYGQKSHWCKCLCTCDTEGETRHLALVGRLPNSSTGACGQCRGRDEPRCAAEPHCRHPLHLHLYPRWAGWMYHNIRLHLFSCLPPGLARCLDAMQGQRAQTGPSRARQGAGTIPRIFKVDQYHGF